MMRPRRRVESLRPVTPATGQHTVQHTSPAVAVLAGTLLALVTLIPILIVWRSAWSARRKLRACPVCGDRAVREGGAEGVSFTQARVWLQCGQCATWRRLQTNRNDHHAIERRLKRDRRRISKRLRQLEAARRAREIYAFIARLRSEIVGAEDFLAGTRAPRPVRLHRHAQGDR
jgi:hypothetical protein